MLHEKVAENGRFCLKTYFSIHNHFSRCNILTPATGGDDDWGAGTDLNGLNDFNDLNGNGDINGASENVMTQTLPNIK